MSADACIARQFVFKKNAVEMKHLELCQRCLPDLHVNRIFSSEIPRTENEADVLTQFSMCCGVVKLVSFHGKLSLY